MQIISLLSAPILAFVIAFLIFPVLIKIIIKWELYDATKDHKIHSTYTPSLGGLAIYLALVTALIIGMPFKEWIGLKYFFISITLMCIVGLRDDILSLTPLKKLSSQLLPILILVLFGQLIVNVSVFSIDLGDVPFWLGATLTIVVIVLITNSYNLIDGLDGLAGAVGIICLLTFGLWFYSIGANQFSLITFCAVGAVLAFLIFNWQPSKIFMGDTGALLIGLLLSYFSIQFLNYNEALAKGDLLKFNSSIGTLLCILIVPVFDTSRVVIFRMRKGLSPFRADKNHIHHQFLKLGYTHSQAVIRIALLNLIFILIAFMLRNQSDFVVIPIVVVLCLLINFGLKQAQKNAGINSKTI